MGDPVPLSLLMAVGDGKLLCVLHIVVSLLLVPELLHVHFVLGDQLEDHQFIKIILHTRFLILQE